MPERLSGDLIVTKLVPLSVPSTRLTPLPFVAEFTDQYLPEPISLLLAVVSSSPT